MKLERELFKHQNQTRYFPYVLVYRGLLLFCCITHVFHLVSAGGSEQQADLVVIESSCLDDVLQSDNQLTKLCKSTRFRIYTEQ
jgi:hypothetical protein